MVKRDSRPCDDGTAPGHWHRVASLRELAGGKRLRVRPDGRDILLVMAGGAVCACDNTCAHQHFSVLHSGQFRDCTVTCPMHGWTYDLRTGVSSTGEGRIAVYPVSVRGDDVFVSLP